MEHGFDIEPRAYFEKEARTNGFDSPLMQAAHHMWKRTPRVEAIHQKLEDAEAIVQACRAVFASIDAWCKNSEPLLTADVCEWRDALELAFKEKA